MPIGATVRTLRLAAGLTQSQLAARAGLSQGQLSRLENGETLSPFLDTTARLASALGVAPADLIGRATSPDPTDGHATPRRPLDIPVVAIPPDPGPDWTWQPTGQLVPVDPATARGRHLQAVAAPDDPAMSPDIAPGDLVLFDAWSRQLADRQLVVVTHRATLRIRWAEPHPDGLRLLDTHGHPLPDPATLEGTVVEIRRRPGRPPPPTC